MSQSIRTIGLSSLFLLIFTSSVMQSVAETTQSPVLFNAEEQAKHLEAMRSMSEDQRLAYRNEQYQILRDRAAQIGYEMPATPPWTASADSAPAASSESASDMSSEATTATTDTDIDTDTGTAASRSARESGDFPKGGPRAFSNVESRHQEQLEKYRKAAAEKRQAMQERLEKQRQSVQERIARLVEQNAVKAGPERVAPSVPVPPVAPTAPSFTPPAAVAPRAPMYQPYYRMPPPMPPAYPGYY